jgi:hypothetical protein
LHELTSKSACEVLVLLVGAVDVEEVLGGHAVLNLTTVDESFLDLKTELIIFLLLSASLPGLSSGMSLELLLDNFLLSRVYQIFLPLFLLKQSLSVKAKVPLVSVSHYLVGIDVDEIIVLEELAHLVNKPG